MAFGNFIIGTVAALFASKAAAVDNGLAITPQMGWDNWNALGCDVSEDLLLQTAELIVDYGLKDLGYHYVILDDCWSSGRDASKNNSLIADATKFPNGMATVADRLHALGLGFGMYSDAGKYTCGGYAGSLGFETVDANTFASWGVDYLKYDNCFNMGQAGNQQISSVRWVPTLITTSAKCKLTTNKICNNGKCAQCYWKTDLIFSLTGADAWNCGLPGFHCSVTNIMNKASFIVSKAQPGAWNDLDMLEVGNGAMTDAEYVAHFSMWAAAKSPLIMGNDIRTIAPADLSILSNAAVIAVNQDPSGSSAARRWIYGINGSDTFNGPSIQLWSGTLESTTGGSQSDMVVLLINGAGESMIMNASLADIFVDNGPQGTAAQVKMSWEVRDLWANRMSTDEAAAIIAASSGVGNVTKGYNATTVGAGRYNATKTSYADGLAANNSLLLGNVTITVQPSGTVTATVDPHGVAMFRLRALPTAVRKRDEL
ncbi:hypothetical protein EG329_006958 [Mollisiaceae sp. DMI_Dod_QoI]|nr:hypothetical protein EG329_006958 [Helotiales sp. DMI_Dod_QoI]